MIDWITVWTVLFVSSVTIFAIMAVVVTIRGARDIKLLLRSIEKGDREDEQDSENKE